LDNESSQAPPFLHGDEEQNSAAIFLTTKTEQQPPYQKTQSKY